MLFRGQVKKAIFKHCDVKCDVKQGGLWGNISPIGAKHFQTVEDASKRKCLRKELYIYIYMEFSRG